GQLLVPPDDIAEPPDRLGEAADHVPIGARIGDEAVDHRRLLNRKILTVRHRLLPAFRLLEQVDIRLLDRTERHLVAGRLVPGITGEMRAEPRVLENTAMAGVDFVS